MGVFIPYALLLLYFSQKLRDVQRGKGHLISDALYTGKRNRGNTGKE